MAPPQSTNDGSASSIYTFPSFTSLPISPFSNAASAAGTNHASRKITPLPQAQTPEPTVPTTHHYVCSSVPAAAASFLLRRRLLLPAFAMPLLILVVPPSVISFLSLLANLATGWQRIHRCDGLPSVVMVSTMILFSSLFLEKIVRNAISRHAPDEKSKKRALAQSRYALPFWSLVISIVVVRTLHSNFGTLLDPSRGWIDWVWGLLASTSCWVVKIAGLCARPALGWALMSLLVTCRYTGPFFPIGKFLLHRSEYFNIHTAYF